jgi:EAL domain-containing protein (putative c-di-GMP-specific phosphodiesterase class I)
MRVESVHLTGPLPAVRRLVAAAADLGIDHEVLGGVLRVPTDAAPALFDRAGRTLAPLEAALVRVVRTDLVKSDPGAMMAATSSAPTLAHVIARRRHRGLLDSILSRSGVAVGFQPVVDLHDMHVLGYEALLRVRAGGADVPPADVLAAAEEAGRLVEVDGVARAAAVDEAAPHIGERLLFLNVLPASLPVPVEHLATFTRTVVEHGLAPSRVVLEAPVGPAGALRRQLVAVFEAAREAGFLIGLDNVRSDRDLGSVLIRPDTVKLDRSLVRGLPSTSSAKTFGQILRETSHTSSLLIAQGIESADHVAAVRDLGVTAAQGWHLGRPGAIPSASEVAADAS